MGIDDSPFKFEGDQALVVGAVVRIPDYLEGVMRTEVTVDGRDATEKIADMVSSSRYKDQIRAILLDGIALAGFNVVDIERLSEDLEMPVLTVTRDRPDFEKMKEALVKHFGDWEERYALITRLQLRRITTEHKPLYACGTGAAWSELEQLVKASTVRGVVPEPIRMAHLIAAAMVKGESYGRS